MGCLLAYGLFWHWQILHRKSEIVYYSYNGIICSNSLFRVDCILHTVRSIWHFCALGTMLLCTFQRAYFPAWSAVHWDTNYILVFPIKPHYMKLLLHASTQMQLSYLRICIFHFSFVPIDLPTVSVCTVFAHTRSDTGYVYRTYSDRTDNTFAHTVSVSLLLHCNRSVHNFYLELNWGLIWKFYCNLKNSGGLEPPKPNSNFCPCMP